MISNSYASSSLEAVGSVWRLKGPSGTAPKVSTTILKNSPDGCPSGGALALVLRFANKTEAEQWIDVEQFSTGPCDISAFPLAEGFELRFSYPQKNGNELTVLSYETQTGLVVDHWLEAIKGFKTKVAKSKKSKKDLLKSSMNPLLQMNETLEGIYEDQESWAKILGKAGTAFSFDAPELERFRTKQNSDFDRFNRDDLIKVPLKIPLLPLPYLDAQLHFEKQELEVQSFEESDLVADPKGKFTERDRQAALKGLNFFIQQIKNKEWTAANEGIRILESSKYRGLLPRNSAMWWALKGYVTIELGKMADDKLIMSRGFDYWRDGLRKTAGRGGAELAHADYMLLESLRYLFQEDKFYAAAATLAWVQKYRWSPATEERISFLRAEVHYRLGLMDEAYMLFEEFIEARKKLPVSAAFDRRLLPVGFFRLGDVRLRQKRYQEAVADYTTALNKMPSLDKVNFEGAWYPSELRFYPQVLFHRAESNLRLGKEQTALADLRAFAHFSLDHPNSSLILFRIGDVLESLGAEPEKIDGTWRECVFRSSEGVGSRLCAARQSVRLILTSEPSKWPRLAATVEDVVKANNLDRFQSEFKENIKIYRRIILADALLKRDSPYQAFEQLERDKAAFADQKLKAWAREFQLSALAGHLQKRAKIGRYREVIKEFSQAKNRRILDIQRPEIQWPLVESYKKLGIVSLASEQLDLAWPYVSQKMPHSSRPYLPSMKDWAGLRLNIYSDIYEKNPKKQAEVKEALKDYEKFGASRSEIIRARIKIASIENDADAEIKAWSDLRDHDILSWEDVGRFAKLLGDKKHNSKELKLLEQNVGAWLTIRKDRRPEPTPPAALVFALFESREKAGQWGPAFASLNYLKGLDDSALGASITKPQLLYREGNLNKEMGRKADARQSFESAKSLAPESVWGKLSDGELGTL
ncbi:tetratricopeptide repeat protein [bacterium]|nr:tetratricopeptide repeat protein [bacterium]